MWCMLSSAMLLNVHPIRTYKKQYGDYILYVHICTVKSQVFFFAIWEFYFFYFSWINDMQRIKMGLVLFDGNDTRVDND